MAGIKYDLSRRKDARGVSEVLVCMNYGAHSKAKAKSRIYVPADLWRAKHQRATEPRTGGELQLMTRQANKDLDRLRGYILDRYASDKETAVISSQWLTAVVASFHNPASQQGQTLEQVWQRYSDEAKRNSQNSVRSAEYAFAVFLKFADLNRITTTQALTPALARAFVAFAQKDGRHGRSLNSVALIAKKMRAFFSWCVKNDYLTCNPFALIDVPAERYGTPFALTVEERNRLRDAPLEGADAMVRDVFVFQCLTGCRVSDLMQLRQSNVINGALEYIAKKTASETPRTIRVPLLPDALAIIERYRGANGTYLMPAMRVLYYNRHLKDTLRQAGITRNVTILNTRTRTAEVVPLWSVASSHLARRTFVSTAVNACKSPALVAEMSGHSPNSTAIRRYYTVEEQTKRDILEMIR